MIAHIGVPALDPTPAPMRSGRVEKTYGGEGEVQQKGTMPATASPAMVSELLRKELGFDGLVVTDAMDMGGLADHFDPGEGAIRAILAGCDQVLKSGDPDAAIDAVIGAAKSGRIPMPRIYDSAARVIREKLRLGLFDPAKRGPSAGAADRVATKETDALIERIARESLTLVRDGGDLPLRKQQKIAHLVVCDDDTKNPAAILSEELARGTCAVYELGPRATDFDLDAARAGANLADAVIVTFVVRARTGAGSIRIPPPARALLGEVLALGKPIVGISLGSPYVISEIPALRTYLAAYGSAECSQRAVGRAIFGEATISGTLPVTIPGIAARGTGIRKERNK
jgi:beta-N-acetylhexosaminidase